MNRSGTSAAGGAPPQPRPFPATLSVVAPLLNEEECIGLLRRELTAFADAFPARTEIVLVDDGSTDRTPEALAAWAHEDRRVKVILLSRNFGHQIAATAGYDYATGDAVVLIDADLQDPIDVIPRMVERYCEGYDVVYGLRKRRLGEPALRRAMSWLFYRAMRALVDKDLPADAGDFRLISRECLNGLRAMRETHRYLRGMVIWVGFSRTGVEFDRAPRAAGSSKYPLRKLCSLAWTAATSFSTLPLRFSFAAGIVAGVFGLAEAARVLVAEVGGRAAQDSASLMILISLLGSAVLISLGIIGQYVGKIYEQSKARPLYLVRQSLNVSADAARAAAIGAADSR